MHSHGFCASYPLQSTLLHILTAASFASEGPGPKMFCCHADGSVEALLAAAGKSLENLPADLVEAVKSGRVRVWQPRCILDLIIFFKLTDSSTQASTELVQRYFSLENNGFLRPFLKFGGEHNLQLSSQHSTTRPDARPAPG